MTEDRFTSLSLMHIEGELSSRIDARDVIAHYAETETGACSFTSLLVLRLSVVTAERFTAHHHKLSH